MSEKQPPNQLLQRLQRLSESDGKDDIQPDAELLSLYLEAGDCEAMERLIRRYSAMVATVCRLTVADSNHAEDAFQATFLVLLQSARKIRKRNSIAAWLHGVAYRTASRIRSKHYSTPLHSSSTGDADVIKACDQDADPALELARKMELEALDRELECLPERLRAPLIEHYMLGFSASEIAERMDLSVTAVEGRLKRGRHKLRSLLARRGISLSILVAGTAFFQEQVAAAESVAWTEKFVEAHLPSVEDGPVAVPPPPSPEISSLVTGELTMLTAGVKSMIAAGIMVVAGTLVVIASNPQEFGQPRASNGTPMGDPETLVLQHKKQNQEPTVQILQSRQTPPPAGNPNAGGTILPANTLAQAGGLGLSGGMEGESGGGMSGGGLGAGGGGVIQEPLEPITWAKPERDPPGWVRAGSSIVSAMEETRVKMNTELDFEYHQTPLQQVAEELSDQLNVDVEINGVELELLGIDLDTPVTASANSSVRDLFRRILEPLELTYRVNESSIEITSIDHAQMKPAIRYYDLSFVLPNTVHLASIKDATINSISPDSWVENGGNASISFVGPMMIVGAPETIHEQLEILLMNIAAMNPANLEKGSPSAGSGFGGGGFGGGGFGGPQAGGGMF
ncbi:MAG: RNA polymerase sigma factor [Planctomycetota bacterium]